MSTLATDPPITEQQFSDLAHEWRNATRFAASPSTDHPAYRAVINLGSSVVPLILSALAESPEPWFAALRELTGADPVPPDDRGRLRAAAEHWLAWGRERGLV